MIINIWMLDSINGWMFDVYHYLPRFMVAKNDIYWEMCKKHLVLQGHILIHPNGFLCNFSGQL